MGAAAFEVFNSASVIRFQSLHLRIRQPVRVVNCNRAVEIDCAHGFTVSSIQNGVAEGVQTGPAPDVGADASRFNSSGGISAAVLDRLKRRARSSLYAAASGQRVGKLRPFCQRPVARVITYKLDLATPRVAPSAIGLASWRNPHAVAGEVDFQPSLHPARFGRRPDRVALTRLPRRGVSTFCALRRGAMS